MKLALGADQEIGLEVLAKDDRAAGFALDPQAFRAHAALFRRRGLIDRLFVALKPSHFRSSRSRFSVGTCGGHLQVPVRKPAEPSQPNSRFLAEPVYPSCTGVSPRASP